MEENATRSAPSETDMCDLNPNICGMEAGCWALKDGGYTCLCDDFQPTGPNNSCDRSRGSPSAPTAFASDQLLGMLNKSTNVTSEGSIRPEVIYSIGIAAISAAVLVAVFIVYKVRSGVRKPTIDKCMQQYNPNYYSTELFKTMHKLEIRPENVSLQEEIGEGFFGKVYRGLLTSSSGVTQEVAVKTLKDEAEALSDFEREVDIMSSFNHENILQLLGVVVTENHGPPWMIFEFMKYGDLAQFLRKASSQVNLNQCDLVRISVQIAQGMSYLSSQHFVHRDLATRNCLVGDNMAVKISDFGLSRDIYTSDYYKVGGSRLLPIRWMAPESITYGKFSLESDVWAYGVVLWEIFTFGKQPYYGHSNDEVVKLILQGILLSPPENCPSYICHIMIGCWKIEPRNRLNFPEILEHLHNYEQ